jgi:hypothetical protein
MAIFTYKGTPPPFAVFLFVFAPDTLHMLDKIRERAVFLFHSAAFSGKIFAPRPHPILIA